MSEKIDNLVVEVVMLRDPATVSAWETGITI